MLIDEGRIHVTDGKNKVHLNFGREEKTIEELLTIFHNNGELNNKENLDNSILTFGETSFSCYLKPSKLAENEQELVISLEANDLGSTKIKSVGPENCRPTGTFYLGIELGNSKIESLKKQVAAKSETMASVSKLSEGEIDLLIGTFSGRLPGQLASLDKGGMSCELPEGNDIDQIPNINIEETNWEVNDENVQPIIPEITDEYWLRFDQSKNKYKTKDGGAICDSIEDFVAKSNL